MRMRARLLHVLVIAPVAALTATALGSVSHAQAATSAPQPIVVALDPGHGGLPNNANPTQPFDPGAVGANGVLEKDVTLDVARRVRALLEADRVRVVLTRNSDVFVTIPDREQVAIDNHAAVFVSIHCNWFSDASVGGSLVLYPNARAEPFAHTLSDALGRELAGVGVANDGVQLRDNWWIHAPMPTSTAEIAYLTNPREAAMMATEPFRENVAVAIRDGIERYLPAIATRRAQIIAWDAAHPPVRPAAPSVTTSPPARGSGSWLGTLMAWIIVLGAVSALVRWRGPATRAALMLTALVVKAVRGSAERHSSARRRRRRTIERGLARHAAGLTRARSVYDELWF